MDISPKTNIYADENLLHLFYQSELPTFQFPEICSETVLVTERRVVDIVAMETITSFFCSKNAVY